MIPVMRSVAVGKISVDELRVLAALASGSIPDKGVKKERLDIFELQEHPRHHADDQADLEFNLMQMLVIFPKKLDRFKERQAYK